MMQIVPPSLTTTVTNVCLWDILHVVLMCLYIAFIEIYYNLFLYYACVFHFRFEILYREKCA